MPIKPKQKRDFVKKASVSMILDGYDDIFSDFDPRPYQERAISDDFLHEAQKVVHEKKYGVYELQFLLPKWRHRAELDKVVRERLRRHFREMEGELKKERSKTAKKGLLLTLTGFAFMFIASYASLMVAQNYLYSLALVFLEPGGWFMVWYGLDIVFYISREKDPDIKFYSRLSRAAMRFERY